MKKFDISVETDEYGSSIYRKKIPGSGMSLVLSVNKNNKRGCSFYLDTDLESIAHDDSILNFESDKPLVKRWKNPKTGSNYYHPGGFEINEDNMYNNGKKPFKNFVFARRKKPSKNEKLKEY